MPGVVDAHVFQVPDAPALDVDVDRTLATQMGIDQRSHRQRRAGHDQFAARRRAPNFWVDPKTGVSYPLVVQMPTYHINSAQDLWTHAGDGDRPAAKASC